MTDDEQLPDRVRSHLKRQSTCEIKEEPARKMCRNSEGDQPQRSVKDRRVRRSSEERLMERDDHYAFAMLIYGMMRT